MSEGIKNHGAPPPSGGGGVGGSDGGISTGRTSFNRAIRLPKSDEPECLHCDLCSIKKLVERANLKSIKELNTSLDADIEITQTSEGLQTLAADLNKAITGIKEHVHNAKLDPKIWVKVEDNFKQSLVDVQNKLHELERLDKKEVPSSKPTHANIENNILPKDTKATVTTSVPSSQNSQKIISSPEGEIEKITPKDSSLMPTVGIHRAVGDSPSALSLKG